MANNFQVSLFSKDPISLTAAALNLCVCPFLNFAIQFNSAPTPLYSTHLQKIERRRKIKQEKESKKEREERTIIIST